MFSRTQKLASCSRDGRTTVPDMSSLSTLSIGPCCYAACRPRVFGFLARLAGRKDLAEDLLQETFLRLAARGDGLAADTRLLPWLLTVARNLYVSDYRSRHGRAGNGAANSGSVAATGAAPMASRMSSMNDL